MPLPYYFLRMKAERKCKFLFFISQNSSFLVQCDSDKDHRFRTFVYYCTFFQKTLLIFLFFHTASWHYESTPFWYHFLSVLWSAFSIDLSFSLPFHCEKSNALIGQTAFLPEGKRGVCLFSDSLRFLISINSLFTASPSLLRVCVWPDAWDLYYARLSRVEEQPIDSSICAVTSFPTPWYPL